jgi:hypothetical protein
MNDGVYTLVQVTKEMLSHIKIVADLDYPINQHIMKDGSGYFYGCICR